jgi:hypothetical protein
MKALRSALLVISFVGLIFIGCSDESQSPVSPSDQASLQKNITRDFTGINDPTGTTNPAIYKYPDGKIMVLKHTGPTLFTASFPDGGPDILSGPGEIEIEGITDLTSMTGQWRGKLTLTPDGDPDGLWQITWHGPSVFSPTAWQGGPGWILSLQMTGHGEGGDIHGMQIRSQTTVYAEINFQGWYGDFIGVIKSH